MSENTTPAESNETPETKVPFYKTRNFRIAAATVVVAGAVVVVVKTRNTKALEVVEDAAEAAATAA
jgi:hypothetical protein